MLRKTRLIALIVIIISLHLLLVNILSYDTDAILQAVDIHELIKLINDRFSYPSLKDGSLDGLITAKFNTVYGNQNNLDDHKTNQLYLLDFSSNEEDNKLKLELYLADPDKYVIPPVQKFDPRFTFSFMLNYLSQKMEEGSAISDLELPYFHWADWTDLSVLDEYYFSKDKTSCKSFDLTKKNERLNRQQMLLKPEQFCLEDSHIEDLLKSKDMPADFKKYLESIQKDKYSTGFHIFDFSGKSSQKFKILHGKSYLSEFMAPPLNIVYLISNGSDQALGSVKTTVKAKVNQDINARKRIIHTDMVSSYITKAKLEDDSFYINVKEQVEKLCNLVRKNKPEGLNTNLPFKRELRHEQFVERSESIIKELDKKKDLEIGESLYKESMEYSQSLARPKKYFWEARLTKTEKDWSSGSHCDWRFFNGVLKNSDKSTPALYGLIKAWLSFTNANNFATWLAHGSLLSWYWDGVSFPWDNDIDVQMPIDELHRLALEFNQSIIVDLGNRDGEEIRYGRYFLDISSFIDQRTKGNGFNNIDGRFIDMDTGLYIDITGLAVSDTKGPERYNDMLKFDFARGSKDRSIGEYQRNEFLQAYNCKNNHFVRLPELSPLKLTIYEGMPCYVPSDFDQILINEYKTKGIEASTFQDYTFLPNLRIWVKRTVMRKFLSSSNAQKAIKNKGENVGKELTVEEQIDLMFQHDEILFEYLLTKEVTAFHEQELPLLLRDESTENLHSKSGEKMKEISPTLRHDIFNYISYHNKYSFEDSVKKTYELFEKSESD